MPVQRKIHPEVRKAILQRLLDERPAPGAVFATETDLARSLGVVRLTVHKADRELVDRGILRAERGRGLSYSGDAAALHGFAQELGLRPRGSRGTIGVVLPENTVFFGGILRAVERAASDAGFALSVMFNDTMEHESAAVASLIERGVDGLLLSPVRSYGPRDADLFERLLRSGLPTVFLGRPPCGAEFDCVMGDDATAVFREYGALSGRGHRKVLYVCDPAQDEEAYATRRQGFEKARLRWFPGDASLAVEVDRTDWIPLAEGFIRSGATAAVLDHDGPAPALCQVLQRLGIPMPDGFEMVAYDSMGLAERLPVPLSTLEVQCAGMGRRAFEMLLERMPETVGDPLAPRRYLVFPAVRVTRGTTRV